LRESDERGFKGIRSAVIRIRKTQLKKLNVILGRVKRRRLRVSKGIEKLQGERKDF
jgi:hypothetical protein